MKKRNLLLFLIIFLLYGGALEAADLASMQKMALENRALVKRFILNSQQSEEDINLARGNYYPSVDISYIFNQLDESSISESSSNRVAMAQISWNLFDGFADKYRLESAKQLREVELLRLRSISQDIQLLVALGYLNVYDRLANLRVAEDTFKTLEKTYRDGENRFEVGLIGKNELLKIRVDYDNADITLQEAKGGLEKSLNTLSRQVGREVVLDELSFSEFDVLPKELIETEYTADMFDNRSEVKALEGLVEAADFSVKASKGDYYPQVDLVGSYSHYDNDLSSGAFGNDDTELRAQLVLSMNLFRGFTKKAATTRAKLEKRGLQYDLEELKDTLQRELQNLFIDYRVSRANVPVAKRSIEQAEENLRIAQLKYDEGLEQESDLLDAISNRSRAQFNEVSVIRALFGNYFRLQRMVDGFEY